MPKKNGINISGQKGRQFKTSDFDEFDYIFVMDNSNFNDVNHLAKNPEHKSKVHLILNELFPDENVDVPDPYFGATNGFENVYQMLDEVTDLIAEKLIKKHA
ncbi:hypothetical protein AAGS39_36820 [Flavobacterium sp. CGRL2]